MSGNRGYCWDRFPWIFLSCCWAAQPRSAHLRARPVAYRPAGVGCASLGSGAGRPGGLDLADLPARFATAGDSHVRWSRSLRQRNRRFRPFRSLPLSLAALMVVGASDMVSVVIRSSMLQLATPASMRGRVSAVNSLFVGASNELGEFESGVTAQWWGAVRAVVAGGLGALAVTGLWSVLFPSSGESTS